MMRNAGCKTKDMVRKPLFLMEQSGFTLVEILIAMGMAAVVGMIGYVVFTTSNWSYKVQEDVSELQQTVRFGMERLSKDLRTAGFGLPDPPFSLTFTGITNPITSTMVLTNSSVGADSVTIIGIGYEAGTLSMGANTDCNVSGASKICLDNDGLGAPNSNNFFTGTTTFVYVPNRRYISINGSLFIELNGTQTDADRLAGKLAFGIALDRTYPDSTLVYIIQAVQYTVSTTQTGCSTANPCMVSADYTLLRGGTVPGDGLVVAENIEDLQFAYGVDASPLDGRIDYTGAYGTADLLNAPADPSAVIAVRANIVARTRNLAPKGAATFSRQCLEDRSADTACTGAALDGYRRRSLTKLVKVRNPRQGY